jgi:hypothetical protein
MRGDEFENITDVKKLMILYVISEVGCDRIQKMCCVFQKLCLFNFIKAASENLNNRGLF